MRLSTPLFDTKLNLVTWINRTLEFLWLSAAVLVPIAFIDRNYAVSEAVIAYVEVPKIALLRTVAGLMAMLWLLEWAILSSSSSRSFSAWSPSKFLGLSPWSGLGNWLKGHPNRWLLLAVWLFLGSTLVTTIFSGSFRTSLWGEIPGQDGYAAYTVASYGLLFAVIATHLKSKPQMNRMIAALVGMGVLVAGYAIFQHYGHDFLDLTEQTGGGTFRVTSFMGNAIFSAAVMSMTIPITLMAGTVTFRNLTVYHGKLRPDLNGWLLASGITSGWGVVLAIQLLGLAFTLSRGPWVGTAVSIAGFFGLALLFVGWRVFGQAAVVLGLAAVLALAALLWQGSVSMPGMGTWSGALLALGGLAGVGVIHFNWRLFSRLALPLGVGMMVLAAVVLGPSGLKDIGGFLGDQPRPSDSPVSNTAGELGSRISSIGTEVLTGFSGGRGTHWRVSWLLIRERPWFDFDQLGFRWMRPLLGYGPDLFRFTYLLESPPDQPGLISSEADNAHNYFIHQTVEQGILGLMSSVGIFLASLFASGYLLMRQRQEIPSRYIILIIGLLAIVAGRFIEMTVGVARVSDLTVLWIVLALLAALLAVSRSPAAAQEASQISVPRRSGAGRRNRPHSSSSNVKPQIDFRLMWRLAIVAWLVGAIGMLTWVKGVNYVRAAVVEAQGVRHFNADEYQPALTSLDRAIELAPDVPVYHTNRAKLYLVYLVNKHIAQERECSIKPDIAYDVCLATETVQSNLDGTSQRPFYYRSRLASAHSAGLFPMYPEAIRLYNESLSMLPNSWAIRDQLAETYIRAGQPDAALQPLQDSLRITEGSFGSAKAYYLLGVANRDLGELETAATALESALAVQSTAVWAPEALKMLTELYSTLGRQATLDRLNENVRKDSGSPALFYLRGRLLAQMGRTSQAFDDFDQSYSLGFRQAGLFARRGRMAQLMGGAEEAKDDLRRAVVLDPENALFHAYLGDNERLRAKYDLAAPIFETAIRLDPRNSPAVAYQFRGLLYHELGLFQRAIEDFDQAIKLDPALVDIEANRAETYRRQDIFAKTGLVTPVLEDHKRRYSTDFNRGEFLAWQGRMGQLMAGQFEAGSDGLKSRTVSQ